MATSTVAADDRRVRDETREEVPVGNLYLSEIEMASRGATWQPDVPASRPWLDIEPHPPDDECWEAWDDRPSFAGLDAYGEDVLRLRRCLIGP
jgi:hypothetical protein